LEDVKILNASEAITKWGDEEIFDESLAKKVARFWPHIQKTG
jgi:hypothetical protein